MTDDDAPLHQPPTPTGTHVVRWKDLAEIAVGASVMVIPLAVSQEVWDLGQELHLANTLLTLAVSWMVIAAFVVSRTHDSGTPRERRRENLKRVAAIYGVTLAAAALFLLCVDKLPLVSAPVVALKRAIIASLPGAFLATVVDAMP